MSNNYLSTEKQATIVAMLCEGVGIRPAERITNAHRDTIMRLGRDVGEGYARRPRWRPGSRGRCGPWNG